MLYSTSRTVPPNRSYGGSSPDHAQTRIGQRGRKIILHRQESAILRWKLKVNNSQCEADIFIEFVFCVIIVMRVCLGIKDGKMWEEDRDVWTNLSRRLAMITGTRVPPEKQAPDHLAECLHGTFEGPASLAICRRSS